MAIDINHQTNKIKSNNTDTLTVDNIGSLIVPKGTTGQRPTSPTAGMVRYNTTTNKLEIFDTGWTDLNTAASSGSGSALAYAIALGG